MTQSGGHASTTHEDEVALIVGGGPGVSASCARLFSHEGMKVAIAARNPDKPHLKNNLAWTMLEVDQEWYRDSLRAKELAEEAVAAKREPAFLDTLAEACYQTGDFSRAISLEEEALSMKPSKYGSLPAEIKIHFENQLEKFRRAAEADKAKPAVAN